MQAPGPSRQIAFPSAMTTVDALYGRRSLRDFTSQQVDKDVLQSLVDAAVQAPSAMNEQPWLFTIVTNRALLDRIAHAAKTFAGAFNGTDPDSHHVNALLQSDDFHIFYHAPALIVISAPSRKRWTVENCALAAENLMLAAHVAGLGSCWIGFAQSWLGTAQGKQAIGLSESFTPVAPIIVGYPKSTTPAVPRSAPSIHWLP
jgi:nitroreductase